MSGATDILFAGLLVCWFAGLLVHCKRGLTLNDAQEGVQALKWTQGSVTTAFIML